MLHHESQVKILYLQVVPKPIWIYCQFSHPSSLESIPESHGTPSQGTAPVLISITFSPVFLFSPENLYHLCSRKKKIKVSQTLISLISFRPWVSSRQKILEPQIPKLLEAKVFSFKLLSVPGVFKHILELQSQDLTSILLWSTVKTLPWGKDCLEV